VRGLREIVETTPGPEKVYYAGFPFQMLDISDIITADLLKLIPVCALVVILTLLISFRSVQGVLLPLATVLISSTWTLGIMSFLRIPLTVISDVIPVILMAVGSAYSIHVVSRYNEISGQEDDRGAVTHKALRHVIVPVLLAALTTIIGFLSFIFGSYLTLIREFGVFCSLGIFFALVVSLTFVPAVLSLLPRCGHQKTSRVSKPATFLQQGMESIAGLMIRTDRLMIIAGCIIAAAGLAGIPRIERKAAVLDYFKDNTRIRKAERIMRDEFGGSLPIQVLVKGDMKDPRVLHKMKRMQRFLDSLPDVNKAQSVADLIERMNDVLGDGKMIPDSREKVANLWFMLEGEPVMDQMVNQAADEGLIQATVANVNTSQVRTMVRDIERYIEAADTSVCTFTQTGMHVIYRNLDVSIFNSLFQSLGISIFLIYVCVMLMLRSAAGGLLGLIPIGLTLLVIFGFMGYTGIPLDIVTVLIGSVSLGIGIDYTIHLINRFRIEYRVSHDPQVALRHTLRTTGAAIVINALAVIAGFLVLLLADLVPLQQFGLLVALTMAASACTALTVLPSVMMRSRAVLGDLVHSGVEDPNTKIKEVV
jgi:uncharacterized protein